MKSLFRLILLTWVLSAPCHALWNGKICLNHLRNIAHSSQKTFYIVSPISGSSGLEELTRAVLPADVQIVVLLAPGSVLPPSQPNLIFAHLPQHLSKKSSMESLQLGIESIRKALGTPEGPAKVLIGAENGVDWGLALKRDVNDSGFESDLSASQMVSKGSVRKKLEGASIPNLVWPIQFEEKDFDTTLKEYAEKFPKKRLAVKFDNSSGMEGLLFCTAENVFANIAELKLKDENKHKRSPRIIVEGYIDDIPLPAGQKWKEIAVDGVAYRLPSENKTRVKFFSAWIYEKDENKMYLSDNLTDPNQAQFAGARSMIEGAVNALGYSEGGLHFEIYMPVDVEGRIVANGPIVLGDPNFRFGGNNKFAEALVKKRAFTIPPNEMLLLGAINPEALHKLNPKVSNATTKVIALSFPRAPSGARLSNDPSDLLAEMRRLGTYAGVDTVPWTQDTYKTFTVGRGKELKDVFEIVLIGSHDEVLRDEMRIREIEIKLSQLMRVEE